jgi:pimeloyl-ACP methyl ester carboxylesterase
MLLMTSTAGAQKPLFISEEGRKVYMERYDALLSTKQIPVNDVWIDTHLGRCHLIETGDREAEPLLLLHAAGCSAAEWYANLKELGKTFHIYALDTPGDAGKSAMSRMPVSIDDYNLTLSQILDSLGLKETHLMGHSIGGFIAAGFAMSHPERVSNLILLAPAATHSKMRWYVRLGLHLSGKPGKGPRARTILKMQAYKGFDLDPGFVDLMEAVRDYSMVEMIFPYVYPTEELGAITTPTHLIIGTEEVVCRPNKSTKLAKKKIPGISVHVIQDAGHTPNMERPEEFHDIVLQALRQ